MSNSRFLFSEHEKHISIKLEDCLSFFRIWSMEDLKEVTKKFQRSTQARWPIIAVIFLLWRWALENRKLTFETVVPKFWPLLSSVMKTKQIVIAEKAVSSEAFVQARHNVGLEPLEKMHCMSNSKMNSQYDAMSRYKGLRLLAVDGSKLNLPSRKELENAFGRPSLGPNTHTRYPQAFMVSLDLVRLGWIVDYRLGRYDSSELDFAGELTKNLGYGDLLMADRLYFRTRWIFNLHNKGVKYLLRLSSHRHLSFTKESQQKIETQGKNQTVIDCEVVLKIDTNKKGKPKHLLHCRYVEIRRIEQETLRFLTNLSYDFADSEEIAQLYLLRWGIETDFRLFKGQDHLPIVISRKENTVRQEILLRVLAHNSIRYVQAEACKIKNEETVTANPIIDGNSEKHAQNSVFFFKGPLLNHRSKCLTSIV